MTQIWMGMFPANGFDKPGLRTKFSGYPWEQPYPNHFVPLLDKAMYDIMQRYERGETLPRSALPEASAVYDAKCFARQKPLSRCHICYIAHEPLARFLAQFDTGPGGVVPYPIYEADAVTPIPENWFLLGLGAQKRTFLPDQSTGFETLVDPTPTRPGLYAPERWGKDDEIACSPAAREGADLWAEAGVYSAFFYSAALGQALVDAGYGAVFGLRRARIVG